MKTFEFEKMEKIEGGWNKEVGCGLANMLAVGSPMIPFFGWGAAAGFALGAYMAGCYDNAHY